MTPAARVRSAIDLLDRILAGEPAERALTGWARANRYAGSGDRAAVRDLVFDGLRRRRSRAALAGSDTGRALMLGMLAEDGGARAAQADDLFDGSRHGPAPLTDAERARLAAPPLLAPADAADLPDWAQDALSASWGDSAPAIAQALRHRAPVFLRANLVRATRDGAAAAVAAEGVATRPHPLAPTALEVTDGARRVQATRAYTDGLVDLQDAASQAVVAALPLRPGMRVLDYCAGGGGKTLAMGAHPGVAVTAHDALPDRMADLPVRATRAGVPVVTAPTRALQGLAPFDLVLCDAPCSGSGAWRRSPDARWRQSPADLARLTATQDAILAAAAPLVAPGGTLAYATCSLFDAENRCRTDAFLAAHPGWRRTAEHRWSPLDGGDGFYLACLARG